MSLILSIDSSGSYCSVAIHSQNAVFERRVESPREHSQKILPLLESILGEGKLSLADIDAIAFSRGPGSFTGLRICLGMVQGLAYSCNIPVIPVSTLAATAISAVRAANLAVGCRVFVAIDARMNEVYFATYDVLGVDSFGPVLREMGEESLLSPSAAAAYVEKNLSGETVLIGSGLSYPELASMEVSVLPDIQVAAVDLLPLAAREYASGYSIPIAQAELTYLRNQVAQPSVKTDLPRV